jgi:peptide/nickel transport system substrate-binding protein
MNKDLCKSVARWATLAAVLVVFVAAAACGGGDTQTTTSAPASPSGDLVRGGELTLARLEEPLTLDPVGPSDNGSIYLIEQVTESLVEPDETGAGLVPGLAEKWEVSADGLEYTFHLRAAKFSNGDPVTTDDVLFSLGRASDTKASPYAFLFQSVDKMEAPDASTVKITLKSPVASFLSSMAVFAAGIVPKAVFEADPEGFGNKPVGSGPFMVESYTRGDNVVLVPNTYYWKLGTDGKPLPYLTKVTVKYVPESNARVLGLRNGDFDVIDNVPFNEGKSMEAETDITLGVDEIYKLDYLYINHQNPPLNNRDFVLAMNYATDRQAILDTVFFGYGQIPNSFMPKMNFWDENVAAIPYDPAKAKESLAKSGYDGKPIEILVPAGDAPRKQIAQILQQTWGESGISAKIVELDVGAAWEKVTAGDYQVEVNYITSDINDDDELATMMGDYWAPGDARGFFSWYQNKDAAALLAKARQTSDSQKRAGYYSQVQAMIYGDGYSVPFNFTPALTAYWNYVQNWRTLTVGWWWLDQVWMNK